MRTSLLCLLLAMGPSSLAAQAVPSDTAAVLATVHQVFDAMRTRDSASLRAAFAPDTRMISARVRNGTPLIENDTPEEFIQAVGKPSPAMWDERIYHPEVRIDGRLATVWAEYDFFLGDKFSHCGVDTFILANGADGWKVVSLADTRRQEGCPEGRR